jgi:hypothetical protein
VTPVSSVLTEIDGAAERAAIGRLDASAGLVSATVSPNAVYQEAFEFFQEATGTGVHVLGHAMRNAARSPDPALTKDGLSGLKRALDAVHAARDTIRRRVDVSLRWYGQAMSERNRIDAFLKLWIAVEALALSGNASTVPLVEVLAGAYERDKGWVRTTFAVDHLAQLRGTVVHSGRQPMLHGHVIELVAALYEDVLFAKLHLPSERRAESKLPDGAPFDLGRWQNSGSIATTIVRPSRGAGRSRA